MTHHDLVIVGSGSGNSIIDERFADWSVGLVEGGTFGGTCLNVGCIPTKMFVYPADIARGVRSDAARLGVDARIDGADWPGIRDRIFGRIDAISAGGRRWRVADNANVEVYETRVRLTGPRSLVTADGRELTADRLVLAAGSRATVPDIAGLADAVADPELPVHTSDTVMRVPSLPERVVIIGGGFVAAEFAHVFSALGSEVVIVNRSARLLRSFDADVSQRFTEQAADQWDVRLEHDLVAVAARPDGADVTIRDRSSGTDATLPADVVLVATGRVPNTDGLDVAAAGFDVDPGGFLEVDEYQRVLAAGEPVADVWALGDLSSPYLLKHVANHEMRVVQHNLLHPDSFHASDHRFVPSAVFSHPQVSTVGLTEAAAQEQGRRYVSTIQPYASIAYGWAMEEDGDTGGFCKLLADPDTGQLIGAHIIGYQASALLQPLIQAMSFGLPVADMARGQYWIHPALPELIENALLSLPL